MKRSLTDFELAALSAIPCILGDFIASGTDIYWAFQDFFHSGLPHLMPVAASLATTLPLFAVSVYILIKSVIKHRKTGSKPVQSNDDIDYRIALYLQRKGFKEHCVKAKVIEHRKNH